MRFSFIFYSKTVTADRIGRRVLDDPLLQRMLDAGALRDVIPADVERNDRPKVGDTSDPKWSPVMKDNWPYFIMGVSRMWLGMIDNVSNQISQETDITGELTMDQQLKHYDQVNAEITHIWQQEGYHALLHHLKSSTYPIYACA